LKNDSELKQTRTALITQTTINNVQKGEIVELQGKEKAMENENNFLKDKITVLEQQL